MKSTAVKHSIYPLSILLILSILFLPLVACTGAAESATQPAGNSTASSLPLASQLALGTLKLDDTQYPIDQAQAAELLPLWKALRSLAASDTAAQQEIDALVQQIQSALTADQVKAITDMQLTNEDVMAYMQEQGPMGGGDGAPDPSAMATRQAARQSGDQSGFPGGGQGGGPPDGGFGGMPPDGGGFGGGMRAQVTGTPNAVRQQNTSGINIFLVNLVIRYLEAK